MEPLTQEEMQELRRQISMGRLLIIAIGVDEYRDRAFPKLRTCSNDAIAIKNIFLDTKELNVDPDSILLLTTKEGIIPSKGEIINAAKSLAEKADENDRILFFYSGHGHRIADLNKFFLVPQDVWDEDHPEAFVDFEIVKTIVLNSCAKYKMFFIDACLSGPILTKKKSPITRCSPKFLNDYMRDSKGVTIITSSKGEQESTTQSPDDELSLFTYYLTLALSGRDQEALHEGTFLTISSLYEYLSINIQKRAKSYQKRQAPTIDHKSEGEILLGFFSLAEHEESDTIQDITNTSKEAMQKSSHLEKTLKNGLREIVEANDGNTVDENTLIFSTQNAIQKCLINWLDENRTTLIKHSIQNAATLFFERITNPQTNESGGMAESTQETLQLIMDNLTYIGYFFTKHNQWDFFMNIQKTFHRLCVQANRVELPNINKHWIWQEVMTRVYAIGTILVLEHEWQVAKQLIKQEIELDDYYRFAYWSQLLAMLAEKREQLRQKGWIPLAIDYITAHKWLKDLFISDDDEILSHVCQFNFLEYLYIAADHDYHIDAAYPSFGTYHNYRTEPIIARLITDNELRKTVPELHGQHLAEFIKTIDHHLGHTLSMAPSWGRGAWSNYRIRNLVEHGVE